MHEDQIALDPEIAARLVHAQFPEWAGNEIVPLETSATTSYIFRIGERYTARFPMQGAEAAQVREQLHAEQTAMAAFAVVSPVASPITIAIGEPGLDYPLPWSVQTWIDGDPVTPSSHAASTTFAHDLAALIEALRSADTEGRRFTGGGRGGMLTDHDEWVAQCIEKSAHLMRPERLRQAWASLRVASRTEPDAMCHKDLIPPNLLAAGERLVGVLDTGGFDPADPALDLVVAWHALDSGPRGELRERLGIEDAQWWRGAGWALQQALGLVWYYEITNPAMSALGRSTIARILDAPELGV